jgi:hypothetical protein
VTASGGRDNDTRMGDLGVRVVGSTIWCLRLTVVVDVCLGCVLAYVIIIVARDVA